MSQLSRPQRKGTRFPPDPNTVVILTAPSDQQAPLVGLVIDESYEGCSAVFREAPELRTGAQFLCAVGAMAPVESSVVWSRVLEEGIVRVGLALEIERPSRKK